jgi:type I restriction-modification system DNA methylase subunit
MNNDNEKNFINIIENLDRSKRSSEIFEDFVEFTFSALVKPLATTIEAQEQHEQDYMQIVKKYPKETIRNEFVALFQILLKQLESSYDDFLGSVAQKLEALNLGLDQYFTPPEISKLMISITMGDIDEIIKKKGYVTLSEPTCGSGGMILATAEIMIEKGYNPQNQMWFQAVDLSKLCYQMTYIQTTLKGLSGEVVHGNVLSLEVFQIRETVLGRKFKNQNPFYFLKKMRDLFSNSEPEKRASENQEKNTKKFEDLEILPSSTSGEQFSFF